MLYCLVYYIYICLLFYLLFWCNSSWDVVVHSGPFMGIYRKPYVCIGSRWNNEMTFMTIYFSSSQTNRLSLLKHSFGPCHLQCNEFQMTVVWWEITFQCLLSLWRVCTELHWEVSGNICLRTPTRDRCGLWTLFFTGDTIPKEHLSCTRTKYTK